ncbi:MAG TPA: metal ABC transporter substrate-binding protein [Vicinamibacterales bacterium]|nr:metal ABC transporter substrate-binding protein [Vicinamibacterales bacterium]
MKILLASICAGVVLLAGPLGGVFATSAPLKIVTTTADLAAIARDIGGDAVTVEAIARGYQDPHFVEAKPSFILKFSRADLLIVVGRELEIGWLPPLINSSRNARIQVGATGYLDPSANVKILDLPTGQLTRAMGDVHPSGNPHYWLDPGNGRVIAAAIRDRLTQLDRANQAGYAQRYADFDRRLADAERRWDTAMKPFKGTKVVTYHRSWPNFTDRFGLDVIGYVEPKPGVPPSPAHTLGLITEMKRQQVKVIIIEPYFDTKTPKQIASQTGAQVLTLAPSVGGLPGTDDYIKLFDFNINLLVTTLAKAGK